MVILLCSTIPEHRNTLHLSTNSGIVPWESCQALAERTVAIKRNCVDLVTLYNQSRENTCFN